MFSNTNAIAMPTKHDYSKEKGGYRYDTHDGRGKRVKTMKALKARFAAGRVGAYLKNGARCRGGFSDPKKTGICRSKGPKPEPRMGRVRIGRRLFANRPVTLSGKPDRRYKVNKG
jgi:hypothetical protein